LVKLALFQPPVNVSVTPSSGSGSSQTFSFVFSDPVGFQDLAWQQVIIDSPAGGCYIFFSPSNNLVRFGDDVGSLTVGPQVLGTAGTLQNSHCSLNVGASSVSGSGNNLTLLLALSFRGGFVGTKSVYAVTGSVSGLFSGWQAMGTWTPLDPTPSVVSVTPSSGSGSSQIFSFVFLDPAGYQDLAWQQVIINSVLSPTGGCYIFYSPSNNLVYFGNDTGALALGPQVLGTSGTLQNSHCSLNVGASSVSRAGNNLTLRLAFGFQGGFVGTKSIYAVTGSASGLFSGWQAMGTWMPVDPTPSVVSVTPSSGSGSSQTFSFVFSDPVGYQDLAWQQIIINSVLSPTGGCYIFYSPSNNLVYFGNDTGALALGPQVLGTAGTLQNSHCSLNVGASSVSGSGNNLTLLLALSFRGGFAGTKNIYAVTGSASGLFSGWQAVGTWTP
jgi:hypothetical protein